MRMAGDDANLPPPPFLVHVRWWSVTHWLIAINIAVYVADLLSGDRLSEWGAFSINDAIFHFQFWRWITYAFLHASPTHLVFNMIALWAFGPSVEFLLRPKRYLALYLFSGLGGIGGYLLLWRLRFLDVTRDSELIGASACIFGVLMAAARLSPNRIIRLMLSSVQMRFKTLAWVLIGLAILYIAARGENAGGEAAHLGGAVVGYVLICNQHWFSVVGLAPKRRKFWKPGDPQSNFFRPDA
jgi:membrane associated rhomboid family serine protease